MASSSSSIPPVRLARVLAHLTATAGSSSPSTAQCSSSSSSSASLSSIRIMSVATHDVRFPTSEGHHGSDAMHPDPDYSAVYIQIHTNDPKLVGDGLTFTLGRGNEIVKQAADALKHIIVGMNLGEITADFAHVWRLLASDGQLRWLGPEKGVIHLATGAIVNAIWDLWAKAVNKPLWRLLADLSPEQLVSCIDFRWITDAITKDEAIAILRKQAPTKQMRIDQLLRDGYPAYTTSAGWLGYTEPQLRSLCKRAVADGWTHIKVKVGVSLDDDKHRLSVIRDEIGYDQRTLMVDANQRWDVATAITNMKELAAYKPWFIEEPTSPDDVLGHKAIREALKPYGVQVASGEACQNRVIWKQLLQAGAIDVAQIDSCRVGGVNEVLAILLMAAKYKVPVCPHAGGVGLCGYVQHLSYFDYVSVSASLNIIEYVDHLHEHFVHPPRIQRGRYMAPMDPGYSITMKPSSLRDYTYPAGRIWTEKKKGRKEVDIMRDDFTELLTDTTHLSSQGGATLTFLITGAQGFFGAWIIHYIRRTYPAATVVGFDLKHDDGIFRQVLDDPVVTMHFGDVADFKTIQRVVHQVKPTHIIHLAALQIPTCRVNPSLGAAVNVQGTVNIFESVKTQSVRTVKCVVYASSAGACGPADDYPDGIVDDTSVHRPTNHYGVYKLANEGNARIFWQDHKIPSVGLRPLTVYGVGREVGMTSSPTKAIKAMIAQRAYTVPFNGHTSWNYIEDIAEIFVRSVTEVVAGAHSCNISGEHASVEHFLSIAQRAIPDGGHYVTIAPTAAPLPFPSLFTERSLSYIMSGRVPLTPMDDAIARMIAHYRRLQTTTMMPSSSPSTSSGAAAAGVRVPVFHVRDLE